MSTTEGSWQGEVHRIIQGLEDGRARIDRQRVRDLVNTYLVRSLDTTALRFSLPVLLPALAGASGPGADGAAGVIIEAIKAAVPAERDLGPIAGAGTEHPSHCLQNVEPVTLIASRSAIGTDLWRPDRDNLIDGGGLRLVVRGALPYPGPSVHCAQVPPPDCGPEGGCARSVPLPAGARPDRGGTRGQRQGQALDPGEFRQRLDKHLAEKDRSS